MASRCCFVGLCLLASVFYGFFVSVGDASPAASGPKDDCSTLVLNMADCLPFVSNGSTLTKPEGSCCSGLKKVLQIEPICICEAFNNSGQLEGLLNISKALTLPTACKIHDAPSASKCGLSLLTPAVTPASHAPLIAPGPSLTNINTGKTPAGSPGTNGSHGISISFQLMLLGAFVILFTSF